MSVGDSGSSNTDHTDPTNPVISDLRTQTTLGQYIYKGRRRKVTETTNKILTANRSSIGWGIVVVATAVSLFAWFLTTPDVDSTADLVPPQATPLVPAPPEQGAAISPGPTDDTMDPKGSPENGSQGELSGSLQGSESAPGTLPSCQDQKPSDASSAPPPMHDPDGESGIMYPTKDQENNK